MASKIFWLIIGLLHILASLAIVFCAPIGAILVICKLCAAATLSWIAACTPFIVALSAVPLFALSKMLLDLKGGE